ncbi:MAG: hypothetical protein ACKPKO_16835, partial [Candidatus Fonsibacter sp.]
RLRAGARWRVGTACGGRDSVVKVLQHFGPSSGWDFECEASKQKWLLENFPEVHLIFTDICELHYGRAFERRYWL